MPDLPDNGMIHLSSPHTVSETLARLETIVQCKGIPILARIDHSGDAERAGLKMQPTKLLIFGSAKAGTPVMIATPTVAIDLPLKALAWEDNDGRVWLSYNAPDYLKRRHFIPDNLLQNIAGIASVRFSLKRNAVGISPTAKEFPLSFRTGLDKNLSRLKSVRNDAEEEAAA